MESAKPEKKLILCQCGWPEHQAIIQYWPDDKPCEKMLYIQIHLRAWEGFFRRLWAGLRYVFGYHCRYGHWDEILLDENGARELRDFLSGFLYTGNNAPDEAEWQMSKRVAGE